VFLVGGNRRTGFIERWDGSQWTVLGTHADSDVRGVWGAAPNDVYFTASSGSAGVVLHWDGSQLTEVFSAGPAGLSRIDGSGPSDIWAIGFREVARYDGTSWSIVSLPCSDAETFALASAAPGEAWIGGRAGPSSSCTEGETVWRRSGSTWQTTRSPGQVGRIKDMWAGAANDVWVLDVEDLHHFDAAGWSTTDRGGWVVQHISGSPGGSIWGVGFHRRILERSR
jgi:hypothetical protein